MCEVIIYSKDSLQISEHVQMLIYALSKVDGDYIGHDADRNNIKMVKHAERVFAYELYHQFRSLMTENCGYYLNGEIKKDSKILNWESNKDCYPDLVLHGNPIHVDKDTQYFLCEIKMYYNNLILDDLDKLAKLFDSSLGFKNYISLFVGISKGDIEKKINAQRKERQIDEKTLCICRKDNVIEVFKLSDINRKK